MILWLIGVPVDLDGINRLARRLSLASGDAIATLGFMVAGKGMAA